LIFDLLEEEKITKEIAECIYVGLVHDTGVFQYSCTSAKTMTIAGKIMEMGIDFSKIVDETFCAVYDPNCVEYEECTTILIDKRIPFYTEYTGKIPTEKMVKAADEYADYVNEVLYQLDLERRKKDFDAFFLANSADGISLYCQCGILSAEELMDYRDYYLVAFYKSQYSFEGLIIHRASARGKVITVRVPKHFIGKLVGTKGKNISKISKSIGTKHIIAKPLI